MKSAIVVAILSLWTTLAAAQGHSVGGHVGMATAIVSRGDEKTTMVTDEFSLSVPIGLVVRKNTTMPIDMAVVPTVLHDGSIVFSAGLAVPHQLGRGFNGAMGVLYNFHNSTWGVAPALDRVLRELGGGKVLLGDIYLPVQRSKNDDGRRYVSVAMVVHVGVAF